MAKNRSRRKPGKARFSKAAASTDVSDEKSHSTESAALIGSNDDILTEILLRLPATSILRFKSVSKHWRSLLSHRLFTLRYDSLYKSPGFITGGNVYVPFDVENQSIALFRSARDLCFNSGDVSIMESCNGLLLCCAESVDAWFENVVEKYYVFNPNTKQSAKILSPLGYSTGIMCMNLAFHQRDCAHYKVVCVLTLDDNANLYQIQTYSSDTRRWKISVESFEMNHHLTFAFVKGVYWNGAIHWPLSYNYHLYFDVNLERLQMCPSPKDMLPSEYKIMYLGESRGHMHLIVTNIIKYNVINKFYAFSSSPLKVYEMLNDHSGWFVKYEVEFHELTSTFPEMIYDPYGYCYDVMDVIRGEKEEDTFMVLKIPGKMIRYNIHDKSCKKISNDPNNLFGSGYFDYNRYTEALTSF